MALPSSPTARRHLLGGDNSVADAFADATPGMASGTVAAMLGKAADTFTDKKSVGGKVLGAAAGPLLVSARTCTH